MAIDVRGRNLDETLRQNATRFSDDYADLVMLSLRQTMAGIEFVARPASRGSTGWNSTDIYGYMKDVGVSKYVPLAIGFVVHANTDSALIDA